VKKHKKWIILLLLFLSLPGLLFWYAFSMPSLFKIAKVYPQTRDLPELQQIKLDDYRPQSGLKLSAYGYALTLTEVQTAEDKSLDRDISVFYSFGEKKGLFLMNPDDENTMGKALYKDETFRNMITTYAGRMPESEFDCVQVFYNASVKDISLVSNEKNLSLYQILISRKVARIANETVYEFDRGDIKGLIKVGGDSENPIVDVSIYRQEDLNKGYCIAFINFNLHEATKILSTITFDEQ
jgi:hypothetical protein